MISTEKGEIPSPPGHALSELPPHHLIDDPCIALDDLDHLGRDVLIGIVRDRDAVIAGLVHLDGIIDGLPSGLSVFNSSFLICIQTPYIKPSPRHGPGVDSRTLDQIMGQVARGVEAAAVGDGAFD